MKLILIAGGTASGKTTIAENVYNSIAGLQKINLIQLDDYYYPFSYLKEKYNVVKPKEINWDDPVTINFDLLNEHLKLLSEGQTVKKAKFVYKTNEYSETEFVTYIPAKHSIIEGIHAFNDQLLEQASLKIYIQADADLRLIRRIRRDSASRRESFDSSTFLDIWESQVRLMHNQYIEPKKYLADIIISTNNSIQRSFNSKIIEIIKDGIVKDNLNSFID